MLIGQMYDDPRYQSARDAGFQIFYMFINIGGIFAPFMAVGIRTGGWVTMASTIALSSRSLSSVPA